MTAVAWVSVAVAQGRWAVAVVQDSVAGYAIDATKPVNTWVAAHDVALAANQAAGVSSDEAWRVVESSIAASLAAGKRWGPRGT